MIPTVLPKCRSLPVASQSVPDQVNIHSLQEWRQWLAIERPPIRAQLIRWLILVQATGQNLRIWQQCELREEEIVVLMRCYTNQVKGPCLTVATVCLPKVIQRKGWFKSFLTECCVINPWSQMVIEDVENRQLQSFLVRINCEVLSGFYSSTYTVNASAVLALNAGPLLPYSNYT